MSSRPNETDEVTASEHGADGGAVFDSAAPAGGDILAGNVADLVEAAARRGPDHPALLDPVSGVTLSWDGLRAQVAAEAARLSAAGVGAGERVLVRLGQGIPYCVALLGALRVGAVAVPVGPHLTGHELALIVADCRPALLVAEPDDRVVAGLTATLAPGPPVLPPPDFRLAAGGARSSPPAVGGGEDIAVLGYTSVTTGVPRGVCLSHRALLANRAQTALLRPVPVSPADRVLLHLPLFHIYGLGAGLLQVCWAGATGVLVDRVEPAEVVAAIRAERVTVVAGVPSMYRSILELAASGGGEDGTAGPRGHALRDALVTVRLCTTGGAPLAGDLLREFSAATGLDVFEGYGLTETGPVLTSTLVGGRAKPGSVGRPLPGGPGVPGVQLRLVDGSARDTGSSHSGAGSGSGDVVWDDPDDPDDWDDLGPDTGLVAVRGPNLFSGYWPDGRDGPDADGWFRTSDVGFIDADGDLHLVDRVGDLVIVNGFNVYPHEVERVLGDLTSVAEAAVVGVPDPRTGEAVKAVLVLRRGAELTEDQVREHCATRLARFKIPSVVEFTDRLPHSATGKITRLALRERVR